MKRTYFVLVLIMTLIYTPVLAECIDCPSMVEILALHCDRCWTHSGSDPDDWPPPDPNRGNLVACVATLTDANGDPAPNIQVNLKAEGGWGDADCSCTPRDCLYDANGCTDCDSGENNPGKTCDTGFTDENGYVSLSVWADADWNMSFAQCEVYPNASPVFTYDFEGHTAGPRLPNEIRLSIGDPTQPNLSYVPFDIDYLVDGLDPTIQGRGTRYTSGPYDNVLVLVQPFDPRDNLEHDYSWIEWFEYYKDLIMPAHAKGYDVWLFEPGHSGENIYEQASELAQVIQHAHDLQPDADEQGTKRTVAVAGRAMGGLVARTALARWSDTTGNSQAWKEALGLDAAPPVGLLALLDAPLLGSSVPLDVQKRMWVLNREWELNLDSCSMQQTLKAWCTDSLCDDDGYLNFFHGEGAIPGYCASGIDLMFPRTDDGTLRAVTSLGDQGYPDGVRVVASSNGRLGERNQCYADSRDENKAGAARRAKGGDGTTGRICGGRPPRGIDVAARDQWVQDNVDPTSFSVGDVMIDLDFDDTCTAVAERLGLDAADVDGQVLFWPWEDVPGSRHDLVLEEKFVELMSNGALNDISDLIQLFNLVDLFLSFDNLGDLLDFSGTDCVGSLGVRQHGMGTNVPATSALDIRNCSGPEDVCQFQTKNWLDANGFGFKHPNIDAWCQNDHSGTHERAYSGCVNYVFNEINIELDRYHPCSESGPSYCLAECGDEKCEMNETGSTCCLDCGGCCGNDNCDISPWEDYISCSLDCEPFCGDLICEPGNEQLNCPEDCGVLDPCNNDGNCDVANGETVDNCPNDCPPPSGGSNCIKDTCVNQN